MKITKIENNTVFFDNGKVLLSFHDICCSERHWAELDILLDYNVSTLTGEPVSIFDVNIADSPAMIQPVKGIGFNLITSKGKFFVPCYGENNGYYGTDLHIFYGKPRKDRENKDSLCVYDINDEWSICLTNCQKISD